MLYCENQKHDFINVLDYIDEYAGEIGVSQLAINTNSWRKACDKMRADFPCKDGLDKANIFKRAAVFVACFIEEKPIDSDGFKKSTLPTEISKHNPNAIIALDIALTYISGATVERSDGKKYPINKGLKLSSHSYIDLIDMLSSGICLQSHFMVLSLLFEQITYKNHPDIQYDLKTYGIVSPEDLHEQEGDPAWDDPNFWNDLSE